MEQITKPKKFIMPKIGTQSDIKVKVHKSHKWLRYTIWFLAVSFIVIGVTSTTNFIISKNWRSPIIFQMPYTDKGIESPVSTRSGILRIEKAYGATEINASGVNVFDQKQVREYVKQEAIKKFGKDEWPFLDELLTRESNYQTYVMNHEGSGAGGIFQALPITKLGPKGLDLHNQVEWGLGYISDRYGVPSKALLYHDIHNWY